MRSATTPGPPDRRQMGGFGLPWGEPEMREDRAGRTVPRVPGCDVSFTHVGEDGALTFFTPKMNPGDDDYPPPVAPTLAHEFAYPPRTCMDCHIDGVSGSPPRLPARR